MVDISLGDGLDEICTRGAAMVLFRSCALLTHMRLARKWLKDVERVEEFDAKLLFGLVAHKKNE